MGRPKLKHTRSAKLSAPVTHEELTAYTDACKAVRIEPADTLRKLAEALVGHVREHKSVTFPLILMPPGERP